MNEYENNKKILTHTPNYYKIINEEFDENDLVTCKLIQIYSEFVFMVNLENKEEVKTLEKIDIVMTKYFSIDDFRRDLTKTLMEMKIKKSIENVIFFIIDCLNKSYDKFLESYTRNIYIPKWI